MVDRAARDRAAKLIRDFRDGRIKNDHFSDEFPCDSKDRAIRAISSQLWFSYDDLSKHKLEGAHALTAEGRELYDRCIAFLESDREYDWPVDDFISLKAVLTHWCMSLIIILALLATVLQIWGVRAVLWSLPMAAGLFVAVQVARMCLRKQGEGISASAKGDRDAWPYHSKDAAAEALKKIRFEAPPK